MSNKKVNTYRLEMVIFTNFKGTHEEAQDKLQEDVEGFESGDAGYFSDNYSIEDPYLDKYEEK